MSNNAEKSCVTPLITFRLSINNNSRSRRIFPHLTQFHPLRALSSACHQTENYSHLQVNILSPIRGAGSDLSVLKRRLGLAAGISAAEYLKDATSGGGRNLKLIVCWEGLIMNDEHVDLPELSTLKSALRSVVEETPDDMFRDKEIPWKWGVSLKCNSESALISDSSRKQI